MEFRRNKRFWWVLTKALEPNDGSFRKMIAFDICVVFLFIFISLDFISFCHICIFMLKLAWVIAFINTVTTVNSYDVYKLQAFQYCDCDQSISKRNCMCMSTFVVFFEFMDIFLVVGSSLNTIATDGKMHAIFQVNI